MGKRVALVLAGCGVFDGSEIHEASAALVHLSRSGAEVKIFAPNIEQRDVVNHLKGSPAEEKRNVLVESARLARGNIQDLAELNASEFDAVIFPGGFGVAKNLCSWAVDGKNCTVNEHVNSTLQAFHSAKKPIGLCCISPVLAAKVFPGCEVTVGQDKNVDGRKEKPKSLEIPEEHLTWRCWKRLQLQLASLKLLKISYGCTWYHLPNLGKDC
ncbi:glutamine amidotransferase-like class 1 domain-containing protein 3, mitochondrial isoform X2 [Vidua chalybeata]|uniref:glutamine amidotransferase-like class 1 domain-containing protein 3, mitochondrial isoform X2 n=1 Tax=Vidua chalybeata TaxID=81927 RepID=UPI0023A8AA38|nr:glutamine amidotransferase-like class 1 domain-containing protein 3, mitochondrial isoform X2 [Vidua chalybeata]